MEYRILGPLEVRSGDDNVRLGAAKQRALLATLLLHANRTVSISRLVDELWGEQPPVTAEKLVQGYVHALRRQLGDGVLETQAPGYRIVVDPQSLDLLEFERLMEAAAGAPLAQSVELRRRALALWRGAPLADVVLEGSDRHALARLSELRLSTQIDQIDAELALGRHAKLVGELEELTAEHPYQERLAARLMLALYRSGRQADALEAYRAIRSRLDDELGLQPGQELRDLEAAILRQDESLDLTAAAPSRLPPAPTAEVEPDAIRAPRSSRARVVLVGAVLVAAAVSAAIAAALVRGDPAPITVAPNHVARIDTATDRVVSTIQVGIRPGPVAEGEGAIWVGNLDGRSLTRIDVRTGEIVQTIPLPATPYGVAVGAGYVWVVNGRLGMLYRVDPSLNEVTAERRLADRAVTHTAGGVAVDRGSVWATFGDSTLARADSGSLRPAGSVEVGTGPASVVFAFGSVWVANSGNATVQRFNPRTFEEGDIGNFTVGPRPVALAAGAGAIWVACAGDSSVRRLDPSLGSESARPIPVDGEPAGVAFGDGAPWVTTRAAGTVARIDPESNEVEEAITVGNAPSGIVVANGLLWVAVQAP